MRDAHNGGFTSFPTQAPVRRVARVGYARPRNLILSGNKSILRIPAPLRNFGLVKCNETLMTACRHKGG